MNKVLERLKEIVETAGDKSIQWRGKVYKLGSEEIPVLAALALVGAELKAMKEQAKKEEKVDAPA